MTAEFPASSIDLGREADFRLGGVSVRPSRREVGEGSSRTTVEPRVMQVLVALARRLDDVVSRDELIASCWDGRIVGDDAINACVAKVRRLGEGTGAYAIETIPRVGYRLAAAGAAAGRSEPQASSAPREIVLAVLPFENLSDDPETGYFSDGLSEEILHTVAQGATGLKVIGRASSFQFRGPEKAVANVARQLKATHVLDGAVRRGGERVRVSAQLVECASEMVIWANRFDAERLDVFALQDDIAAAVALALSEALAPRPAAISVDPLAYDLYLRARASTEQWLGGRDAGLLEQVLALAPRFSPAWGALAMTRAIQARDASPGESEGLRARAREAARSALALDGQCGIAYAALAALEPPCGAFEAKDADIQRALIASPYDPWVLFHACQRAQATGRLTEAHAHAARGREVEPIWPQGLVLYANTLADTGRQGDSDSVFDAARRRWPEIDYIAITALFRAAYANDWDRVERLAADLRELGPFGETTQRALQTVEGLRTSGAAGAAAKLERERRRIAETGTMSLDIRLLCRDGLADQVFDLVEQASFAHLFQPGGETVRGDQGTGGLFVASGREMRADPRFVRLCAKLGLAQYWLKTDRWPDCAREVAAVYDFKAECRRVAGTAPADG